MAKEVNPSWLRRASAIDNELVRLAVACDVSLSDRATIERIIRDDDTVCGRKNEAGFRKLRAVIVVTYIFIGQSIERIGPRETRRIVASLAEHIYLFRRSRASTARTMNITKHGYTEVGSQIERTSRGGST